MHEVSRTDWFPGAVLLRGFLPLEEQVTLAEQSLALGANPAGFYHPSRKSGGQMSVAMMCLGMHWNAHTYAYEPSRSDHDGLPVQPIPAGFAALARRAALAAGMSIEPDICLVNHFKGATRLGLHQDTSEGAESRAEGIPVVSVSLGDSARYAIGGLQRKDPVQEVELRSGDVVVLGGPSRMRFHGVPEIYLNTAPPPLAGFGRISLAFRQHLPLGTALSTRSEPSRSSCRACERRRCRSTRSDRVQGRPR